MTASGLSECQRCGGSVNDDGRCLVCGAQQETGTVTTKTLVEKVEDLISLPGKAPAKLPHQAALVDAGTNERYKLTEPVSKIGRDPNNSIALSKDSYVSRHHAWILFIKGAWWVEDLGSTNGTLLNGEMLTERRQIVSGDRLKLGRTELIFELS